MSSLSLQNLTAINAVHMENTQVHFSSWAEYNNYVGFYSQFVKAENSSLVKNGLKFAMQSDNT